MQRQKSKKNIDIKKSGTQQEIVDFYGVEKKPKFKPVLFSRGKKMDTFFTEDSKLYITPREQEMMLKGIKLNRDVKKWDALSSRVVREFVRYRQPNKSDVLLGILEKRLAAFNEVANGAARNLWDQFTVIRLWNASIIGAILFGMVMMTFVYRYLGQGAAAKEQQQAAIEQQVRADNKTASSQVDTGKDAEAFAKQVAEIQKAESQQVLEAEIKKMVKGYPIEKMASLIAKQDRTVAAFMVAIARKESGWGQHVPVLNGQDCNNYWGYRGKRRLMGSGGHTCFNSPQDAVATVAKRISTLVDKQGKDTPAEMVKTWKCGGNCAATGGQAAANKWVSDVQTIFSQFETQDDNEN